MKEFLLETFPNPERNGCPDEKSIQAIAEERAPLTEEMGLHIGSCSECYAEYRNFRQDWDEGLKEALTSGRAIELPRVAIAPTRAKPRLITLGIAASLLVICSSGYRFYKGHHQTESIARSDAARSAVTVSARVDLFESGTFRGAEDDSLTPLNKVTLPAAIVNLTVVLPRFSDEGLYRLNVSTDKQGKNVVASGTGNAGNVDAGKLTLPVTLDLRNAKAGSYFLATVRGTDNGTYYYPLQIK
jgi:hypothetical protein